MLGKLASRLLMISLAAGSIFGAHSIAEAACTQVSVRAEVQRGQKSFAQVGVGSVFSLQGDRQSLYIVVPSHVVNGADRVFAGCESQSLPLEVLGRSITADVAVARIVSNDTADLKPAFAASADRTSAAASRQIPDAISPLNGNVKIRITRFGQEASPVEMPVYRALLYTKAFLNPLFGDDGSILVSSGVIPGMSGSALLVNGEFAGMISRTLIGDSMSAAVPASEIRRLIPDLINSRDPYGPQSNNLSYLEEPPPIESDGGRTLMRLHSLIIRKSSKELIALKDSCLSGSFAEVSQWQESKRGGWGEGGRRGGWGEGGTTPTGMKTGNFELIQGTDVFSEKERRAGDPTRYASVLLAYRSDCKKEGVLLPDNRRLVALKNYRASQNSAEQTLAITSVDELLPLARQLGPRLLDLIARHGVFADDASSGPHFLCETRAFHATDTLFGSSMDALPIRSSTEKMTTIFLATHLEPAERGLRNAILKDALVDGVACDSTSRSLRLVHQNAESPVKVDLTITGKKMSGTIEAGRCKVSVKGQSKDFWHGDIRSREMELSVDIGIDIHMQGYIRITPARIDPSCWAGTRMNPDKFRIGALQWLAD